jgi:hypothetical protein
MNEENLARSGRKGYATSLKCSGFDEGTLY